MKHYVMGFIFNKAKDKVLLIEKKRPKWQAGHWNGMGGKIEQDDENPLAAMQREIFEETGFNYQNWEHCITFVCPGGTVFVYRIFDILQFTQIENECLKIWPLDSLPKNMMNNLKWIIPVCLSTIQFPLIIQQKTLGVK